jgi:DNA adenine methylase
MTKPSNKLAQPFLKWAGGKRQLLPEIRKYIPSKFKRYFEPFIGGGAVLFDLQPKRAVINDINEEIINVYETIRSDVDALIADLKKHKNDVDYYYKLRESDRESRYKNFSKVKRASRIIYLNKTCYNGLFRVNSQGQFNVPFGNYGNPNIVNEVILRAVSHYLNVPGVDVRFLNVDFEVAVKEAKKDAFVYFDPPYYPISNSASFTGYSLDGFNERDQIRLKELCDDLHIRGCKFLLSNSDCGFIRDLYKGYKDKFVKIEATRNINSVGSGRGKIAELLIKNYE